ncbi:hypothetical protein, partial, partial [Parasitella parasitica]
ALRVVRPATAVSAVPYDGAFLRAATSRLPAPLCMLPPSCPGRTFAFAPAAVVPAPVPAPFAAPAFAPGPPAACPAALGSRGVRFKASRVGGGAAVCGVVRAVCGAGRAPKAVKKPSPGNLRRLARAALAAGMVKPAPFSFFSAASRRAANDVGIWYGFCPAASVSGLAGSFSARPACGCACRTHIGGRGSCARRPCATQGIVSRCLVSSRVSKPLPRPLAIRRLRRRAKCLLAERAANLA